jgi:dTDP-4-dehydrorhamnose reductase
MKVLVLGASGMLGNAMMRVLGTGAAGGLEVVGTVRSAATGKFFKSDIAERLIAGVDVDDQESLKRVFAEHKPDVVINCVGLIKQLAEAKDPIPAIQINALLPHLLHRLCLQSNARLIHFSTDCVFDGAKGNYLEDSPSDATDLYGKSKFLGEVGGPGAVTIRTSIIGHELQSAHSLLEWFLSQQGECRGYRRAIFSGLPTTVMAEIVRDVIIPNGELSGLYHVAAQAISKYDLLKIIADVYGKSIDIVVDDALVIDRSLNADRFAAATGYHASPWPALIQTMHDLG